MEAMNVVEARRNFSELVTRVAYGGSRVIVERRGRPLAALISARDLARLEVWEREHDTARDRQVAALAQARAVRAAILAERGGELLPDSADLIQSIREERADEIAGLR
jgi:prevent-host-death family protein